MSSSKKKRQHRRRKRRATHAILRFGRSAAPKHELKSGRTGSASAKKPKSKHRGGGRVVTTLPLEPPGRWTAVNRARP